MYCRAPQTQAQLMLAFEKQALLDQAKGAAPAVIWTTINKAAESIGLKRSRMYELINEARGAIRTVLLTSPGAKSGRRLVHLPSLISYIDRMARAQETLQAAGKAAA